MRKITHEAYQAFINKEPFKKSNTEVQVLEDGRVVQLLLFGNIIANQEDGKLSITTAGWSTNTAKERLNAFPDVRIHKAKGVWYLNGLVWDGGWIEVRDYAAPI